jgi:hypothetical protein
MQRSRSTELYRHITFKESVPLMIIVVSDIHLGYKKCNNDLFDEFIDLKLTKLNEDDHLILPRRSII